MVTPPPPPVPDTTITQPDSIDNAVVRGFAPAKINLYLHICGKRENDGYHLLDSLVAFADAGDQLMVKPAKSHTFTITGRYRDSFSAAEMASPTQTNAADVPSGALAQNLVIRALHAMAVLYGKRFALGDEPNIEMDITLEKNLPLSAGIGGGSADAAAMIRILRDLWHDQSDLSVTSPDEAQIIALALRLGADVPVCYTGQTVIMRGIGEDITPYDGLPVNIPLVLVNPVISCPTPAVFGQYEGHFRPVSTPPPRFKNTRDLCAYLHDYTGNDLQDPATRIVPQITSVIQSLQQAQGCEIARLSGSGATCFGLFSSAAAARTAAAHIQIQNPQWWVHSGFLNPLKEDKNP